MKISSVIFDLGRTLIPFSFDALGATLEPCRAAVMEAAAEYEIGGCDWAIFERRLAQLTRLDAAGLEDWWCRIFTLEPLVAPELIASLRPHYRVGLLSNTNECHFRFLCRKLPWLEAAFDFHTLSYEVGAAKPTAGIYADAEAKAGCAPGEILYFDDVPAFVAAARVRGWQAELFRDETAVRASLARSGWGNGAGGRR